MLLTFLSLSELCMYNNLRGLTLLSDIFVFLFLMISEYEGNRSTLKLLLMAFFLNASSFSFSIIDGVKDGWMNRNFIFYGDLIFILMMGINGFLIFYILYKILSIPKPSDQPSNESSQSGNQEDSVELSISVPLVFNTFITIANEEKDICLICLSDINLNKGLNVDVLHTICGHGFHSECLKKWLKEKKQCPTCRMDL
jgi:hypothetical protein